MKFKLDKRIKIGIIAVLLLGIVASSLFFFREWNKEEFREDTVIKYSYNQRADIEYQAYLKPNKLYEKNTLGEGELYLTEFIDYIDTKLKYEFQGEKKGDLGGEYEVVARVEAYSGEGEEITYIWQKDFPLIAKKRFKIIDESLNIEEKMKIDLDKYSSFASEIIEASKVNSQSRLNLILNVNLKGQVEGEEVDELISTNLLIPLNTGMFSVGGENSTIREGKIEEKINVKVPPSKMKLIILGISMSVLLLVLVLSVFLLEGVKNTRTKKEKLLKSIFKKHGDRLVAVEGDIDINRGSIVSVKSIDDLVRIADEEGKPIMYKYSDDKDISSFYVSLENVLYILQIREDSINGYQVEASN